jgi:hypothetical protein
MKQFIGVGIGNNSSGSSNNNNNNNNRSIFSELFKELASIQ